jgi:hypothetical protein
MKKFFEAGGVIAGVLLVLFAIGAIAIGFTGRSEVRSNISREAIVGTPDMTPSAIKSEATKAGLQNVDLPSCNVAGKAIDTGDEAKCFASYMRIHTLEATSGYTYSQMGRYQALTTAPKSELAQGGGTDNATYAVTDPKTKQPVANGARDLWVTETALTTALNTSFFAERVAMFSIVVGFALLLTGVGFLVLAYLGVLKRKTAPATATERTPLPTT